MDSSDVEIGVVGAVGFWISSKYCDDRGISFLKNAGGHPTVPVEVDLAQRTVGRCEQRLENRTWTQCKLSPLRRKDKS